MECNQYHIDGFFEEASTLLGRISSVGRRYFFWSLDRLKLIYPQLTLWRHFSNILEGHNINNIIISKLYIAFSLPYLLFKDCVFLKDTSCLLTYTLFVYMISHNLYSALIFSYIIQLSCIRKYSLSKCLI